MTTPGENENQEFFSTRDKLNRVEWNDEIWIERYLTNAKQRYQETMGKIRAETTKLVNMALDVSDAIPEKTYIQYQKEKAKETLELLKRFYTIEQLKTFAMPINPVLYECIGDDEDEEKRIQAVCTHFGYKYFGDIVQIHPRSFCCRMDELFNEIQREKGYDDNSDTIEKNTLWRLAIGLHEYELGMGIVIPEWKNFRPQD